MNIEDIGIGLSEMDWFGLISNCVLLIFIIFVLQLHQNYLLLIIFTQ